MKQNIEIGDSVFNSPVGAGTITGLTERGYPQVNHVAVGRFIHKTNDGEYLIFDPHGSYAQGKYDLIVTDKTLSIDEIKKQYKDGVIITNSSSEAIDLIKNIGCIPKELFFDHNHEENADSTKLCIWLNNTNK